MPIRFETLAVHGGQHPDPTTLSRGVPVYRTSSYLFKSAEHAAKLFGLAEQGNVYGRLGNPTQAMLEERMSLLEGGVGALASASGTSAIFSTIVNLAKQGDEIVSANNLYGGTFTLFNDILPQFGITTRFVKPQDFDKMEAAVNGRTRALYVEAIGNPALDVADLDAVSAIAKRHGLDFEEEAEYGTRKYLEKQDFILAKQKKQLAAQQSKLDELTLKVSDMETLLEDVSAAAYDKAVEVVTDVVRTETRKEDMRMIENTKKWVLSPERKAPKATREYTAKHLDSVLDKFLKTMQTTTARLQEKLLKPEVRQKGKEQVKEKARDSVLQLLNRLQAEQAQNKPAAQPRTQEGHSEI